MQKINFQDLPSTATPINATNLNAIQENVENAIGQYIMVGLAQETTITTTSTTKLPLDTNISSNGSQLTFDSTNNCIVVGQGVSKIELSGMIYVFTIPTTDLVAIYIYKNSSAYARFNNYLRDSYQSVAIPNVVMDVQQGDKIYIYVNNSAQPTKYGGNVSGSYLTNSFIAKVVK